MPFFYLLPFPLHNVRLLNEKHGDLSAVGKPSSVSTDWRSVASD